MNILYFICYALFIPGFWSSGIKNACKYKIDEKPTVHIDMGMAGIWKMQEDTNAHDYLIVENDGDYQYRLTYMNRGGDNRGLEHFRFNLCEINGVKFFIIDNWDENYPGYLYYRINNIDQGTWYITASLVTDPAITKVSGVAELRELLVKNLDNPSFYGRQLHFVKHYEFNSFRRKE